MQVSVETISGLEAPHLTVMAFLLGTASKSRGQTSACKQTASSRQSSMVFRPGQGLPI